MKAPIRTSVLTNKISGNPYILHKKLDTGQLHMKATWEMTNGTREYSHKKTPTDVKSARILCYEFIEAANEHFFNSVLEVLPNE